MFFLVKKKANWDKMLPSTTIPYQVRKKYFLFCLFLNLNKIIVNIWDKLYISLPPPIENCIITFILGFQNFFKNGMEKSIVTERKIAICPK